MSIDNEYIKIRKEKVDKLIELGIDPFRNNLFPSISTKELNDKYSSEDPEQFIRDNVMHKITGRIIAIRSFGKSAFVQISQNTFSFQVFISKDSVGDEMMDFFKKFIDIGDFVYFEGSCFFTKTKQLSLEAAKIELLTKTLSPLPEKWHGLTNVETRYRQRYLDLISNTSVKDVFKKRAKILKSIRSFLDNKQFMEVETPILHKMAGGAAAKPFMTYHNTLDMDLKLRIAPELYLKRLVVGGLESVYEIGRNFRNEGISTQHNPEFTMIEIYQAYSDYEKMMDLIEELILNCINDLNLNSKIIYQDNDINFEKPWKRVHMIDWTSNFLGFDVLKDTSKLSDLANKMKINDFGQTGKIIAEVFEENYFKNEYDPTFVYGFPIDISPLARRNDLNKNIADRFELFINGKEIANAFSELNDSQDQRERFQLQLDLKEAGDEEANDMDIDYIEALSYGLPPTAGAGIGIDRLVMLLTNSASIRDVILFPHLRD